MQKNIDENTQDVMRRCAMLEGLEDEYFDKILSFSRQVTLPENNILFEQGGSLTNIYLLINGSVKLQRLSPGGQEKVIDIIGPGQTFAEAALFFGSPRYPVSAITLSPSDLIAFQAKPFLELLKSSNELCLIMLGKLSQRLHWMVNEVDRLAMHNATFRVVDYLLNQIPPEDQEKEGIITISLIAPKRVIASRLSIEPETFSRTLKHLSEKGLIVLHHSHVELVEVKKLHQVIMLER